MLQIESGLVTPTHIYADTMGRNSYVFVSVNNTYNSDVLHLPVMVVEGTSARLITGYFSKNDYKGTLVWSTNDV